MKHQMNSSTTCPTATKRQLFNRKAPSWHKIWLLVPLLFLLSQAPAQSGYIGVWQPSSGGMYWHTGLSFSSFNSKVNSYYKKGYCLIDIEIKSGRYTGVWKKRSGGMYWYTGLSFQAFNAKVNSLIKKGYYLVDVEIYGGKYTGIWHKSSGGLYWYTGLSFSAFNAKVNSLYKKGYYLQDVEIVNGKYTGIWRNGKGGMYWYTGLNFKDFSSKMGVLNRRGYRLIDIEIYNGKYTGVWTKGSGAQYWYAGLCFEDFKTTVGAFHRQKMHLTDIEFHHSPKGLYKLPFQDSNYWSMGKGNWDDPKYRHGNKKTDLQAFSFDFGFDRNRDGKAETGQIIKAARTGVVHLVVESETENSAGKDFCEHGVGNYVVIRHDDGTYGTYWHLLHNSVSVKKGQRVRQGQSLARCGNTGNSGGPHLHFDVRTGWNDKYNKCNLKGTELPNVRILFEDNNHRCWIPRVGDKLSSNNR